MPSGDPKMTEHLRDFQPMFPRVEAPDYHSGKPEADSGQRKAESILEEAERLTRGDRQQAYGAPIDDYTRTSALFNAAFAHKLRAPLTAEEMMLAMILVKVSRQVHLPKRDNLVDICGYANCIDLTAQERERRQSANRANNETSEARNRRSSFRLSDIERTAAHAVPTRCQEEPSGPNGDVLNPRMAMKL